MVQRKSRLNKAGFFIYHRQRTGSSSHRTKATSGLTQILVKIIS